jgi:excisionase family DNA binding protein
VTEEFSGWITLAEAAERFGVKRDRLRRATLEGRLRAHKVGSGSRMPWLVRPEEMERFLRDTRRGPKPKKQRAAEGAEAAGVDQPMTGAEPGREG